jgi:hypothetical protein
MPRPRGLPKTGGRTRGTLNRATASVKVLAQEYTEAAVLALAEIMENREAPPAARVSAASALLDRGHGKPPQAITGPGGSALIPERAADPDRIARAIMLMVAAPGARPARALIERSSADGDGADSDGDEPV